MPDAAELKVLAVCAFLSGSVLLAPGERVAAGVAYALSAALFIGYRARLRTVTQGGPQGGPQGGRGAVSARSEPGAG
jgi:hypothetical protein